MPDHSSKKFRQRPLTISDDSIRPVNGVPIERVRPGGTPMEQAALQRSSLPNRTKAANARLPTEAPRDASRNSRHLILSF